MGFRNVVVRLLGESVAQRIEQFVEGKVFNDTMVTCPACGRLVATDYLCERRVCPVCGAAVGQETIVNALEARRRTAQEAGAAVNKEVEEIDRRLSEMRNGN